MSKCRSCGAQIHFVQMKSGKNMPVDKTVHIVVDPYAPDSFITRKGEIVRGRIVDSKIADMTADVPHWKNCPGADAHRAKR